MPNATDRTVGICSLITRTPPGSTVRRMVPSAPLTNVRLTPGFCSDGRSGVGTGLLRAGVGRFVRLDRDERQLAARIDLGDLHLDLVADLEDVLDRLDAFATGELAD